MSLLRSIFKRNGLSCTQALGKLAGISASIASKFRYGIKTLPSFASASPSSKSCSTSTAVRHPAGAAKASVGQFSRRDRSPRLETGRIVNPSDSAAISTPPGNKCRLKVMAEYLAQLVFAVLKIPNRRDAVFGGAN